MIFNRLFFLFAFCLWSLSVHGESNIDQWIDDNKTYYDLIQEGFEVKAYDTSNIRIQNGYILMFFVTVLQKNNRVFECQEYQVFDNLMNTLDLTFVCRELVKPYKKRIET